jgi:hypothetical protein
MLRTGNPRIRLLSAEALPRARALRRDQSESERKLWRFFHSRRLVGAGFAVIILTGRTLRIFCCIKIRQDNRGAGAPRIILLPWDRLLERMPHQRQSVAAYIAVQIEMRQAKGRAEGTELFNQTLRPHRCRRRTAVPSSFDCFGPA